MPPLRIWWSAVGLVRVRADDEAGAAVDEMAEAHLLRGRLGVEVDHHRVGLLAERAGGEYALGGLEGIVELGMHEDAAHDVGDEHARAVLRACRGPEPRPGVPFGKVGGPQEALLVRGED